MSYFEEIPKPHILLINFTSEEAKRFSDAGYRVELAFLGEAIYEKELKSCFAKYFHFPKPVYEFDIFIVKTDMPKEGEQYNFRDGAERIPINAELNNLREQILEKNGVIITFLGKHTISSKLYEAGLPFISTFESDPRDSTLTYTTFGNEIKDLDDIFFANRNSVAKVNRYIFEPENLYEQFRGYSRKFYINKTHYTVGAYGTQYGGSKNPSVLKYILLPEFKDDVKISLSVLNVLKRISPSLFTTSNVQEWLKSDEFIFEEVKTIQKDIEEKNHEWEEFLLLKNQEIENINNKFSFLNKILFTDDEHFEGEDKLSVNVKKVLEYIGFSVESSDEKVQGKKKEDLVIADPEDNFKALCEVKGTLNMNPSEGYIGQLSNHMRKNSDKTLKGLLIVNYDYNTHPFNRVRIYNDHENENEEGLFSVDDIGIISTVDLYRVATDVKKGVLSQADAKKILKLPYRIQYPLLKNEKEKVDVNVVE